MWLQLNATLLEYLYTVFDKLKLYTKVPDFLGTGTAMKTLCLVPLLLAAVLAQPRHGGHPQPRHRAMSKGEGNVL